MATALMTITCFTASVTPATRAQNAPMKLMNVCQIPASMVIASMVSLPSHACVNLATPEQFALRRLMSVALTHATSISNALTNLIRTCAFVTMAILVRSVTQTLTNVVQFRVNMACAGMQ